MITTIRSKNKTYLNLESLHQMSDEEFQKFTIKNSPYQFEREPDGTIVMMEPTVSYGGYFNSTLSGELYSWNRKMKLGYLFDSSTGFKLPDGSVRSPDASFVVKERWEALTEKEKNSYSPICPDFVVELKSPSDDLEELKEKMQMYMNNGCRLGWLIDPKHEKVFIYRTPFAFDVIEGFDKKISGDDVLPEFEMDLSILKK
ncbi:MAG TPA: Uma2 family endonuclease [Chitinophagales bacterium]|nr:Uma2 family endonuclease [Chitinophagales bacterium]